MSRIPSHPELLRYIDEVGRLDDRLESIACILLATRECSELDGEVLAGIGEIIQDSLTHHRILRHYFMGESNVGVPEGILVGELARLNADRREP